MESERKGITCDQVVWMLNAINRYLPRNDHPAVSRAREMQSYALLYELMEVAGLKFADERAQHNGTPTDVHAFLSPKKTAEILRTQKNIIDKAAEQQCQGASIYAAPLEYYKETMVVNRIMLPLSGCPAGNAINGCHERDRQGTCALCGDGTGTPV